MRHVLDLWRCSSSSMNRQEAKIFVGGLNWSTSEEKLRSYFENFGSVQEAFVSYDRHTGRPRGFGFVVFEDPVVADKVVSIQHTIDRREVEAKKAVPKDDQPTARYGGAQQLQRTRKIFVGGLAPSVDELAFRKYFEQFGAVEDAVVMYDHDNKRPRGFGFISFYSEEAVEIVLSSGVWKTLHDKPIEIKRAVPRDQMPLGTPTPISSRGGRSWSDSSRGPSARSVTFGMQPQSLLQQQLYNSSGPPYDAFSAQQGMTDYRNLSSSLGQSPLGISSIAGLLSQQQQAAGIPPQLPNSLPSNFAHMQQQHHHQHQLPNHAPPHSLPHPGLADSSQLTSHFGSVPYQLPSQLPTQHHPPYPSQQLNHLAAQAPSASQLMPQSTAAALASLGLGGDFSSRHTGLFNNLAGSADNSASNFHALDLERRMAATMGGMTSEGPFMHPFEGKSPLNSPQSSSANSASQQDSASFGQSTTSFHDRPFSVMGSATPQAHASVSYSSSPQIQSPHLQSPFAESARSSTGTAASPKTPDANNQQLHDQLDMLSLKDKVFASSFSKQQSEVVES